MYTDPEESICGYWYGDFVPRKWRYYIENAGFESCSVFTAVEKRRSQWRRLHAAATLSGSRICSSNSTLLSFTTFRTRCLACGNVSPGRGIGSTRWFRNRAAMTATNSACANFFPGQFRGVTGPGEIVPLSGTNWRSALSLAPRFRPWSGLIVVGWEVRIYLSGRQSRKKSPQ